MTNLLIWKIVLFKKLLEISLKDCLTTLFHFSEKQKYFVKFWRNENVCKAVLQKKKGIIPEKNGIQSNKKIKK